jgi:hypothetical protein
MGWENRIEIEAEGSIPTAPSAGTTDRRVNPSGGAVARSQLNTAANRVAKMGSARCLIVLLEVTGGATTV